ncbi:hypothetical protein PRIPAC_81720 [Pristionchus pacificus]|uniref:RNA-directed DNA polymerase n=1 Tax=Pristionchus pacificus TaxID=54126 RepID=A0A2A6CQ78_PRIPA|nr:hypothetical protein PRIPAC_81720 [Pristionchus pacificus]|eukprot:PDM80191.1 hypothetical protein PRIPAC_32770 [Pristionchus pacificus]
MGTSGGTNGTYRGGYSGSNRGSNNTGSRGGQRPQQYNSGYGNGGARAHIAAASTNGYNNTRSSSNAGTGANSVPLGTKSNVNAVQTEESTVIENAEVQRHEYCEQSRMNNNMEEFFFIKQRELTRVGFYVLNNGFGKVIIGGKGLDDVGVELREVRFREKEHSKGKEVLVLRDAQIEPGQLGSIWVTGSKHNTVLLESSIDQVVEGIAVTERIVNIPVYNDTESELRFTKHQPVGVWKVIDGAVEEVHAGQKGTGMRPDSRNTEVLWKEVREKLVSNRDHELESTLELSAQKQVNNDNEVAREMEESILRWKTAQSKDEWVQEMIQKKSEIAISRREASEITRMPDSTRKLTMADLEIDKGLLYVLDRTHERLLYVPKSERKSLIKEVYENVLVGHQGGKKMNQLLRKEYIWGAMEKDIASVLRECDLCLRSKPQEVNERLKGERERMKSSYDKKWENNKKHEPIVGDRVYAFKEKVEEKNPKLRIKWEGPYRVIDRSNTTATIVGIENGVEKVVQLDKLRKVPGVEDETKVLSVNESANCSRLVNLESPLHWDNVCPGCAVKPRTLKEVWRGCPDQFASFSFPTLKEFAIMRTLIERNKNLNPVRAYKLLAMGKLSEEDDMTDKTIEETIGNLCSHALVTLKGPTVEWRFTVTDINPKYEKAYRRGLGEDVETSLGYGAIVHAPGLDITKRGGDQARWEWRVEMPSDWGELFSNWHRFKTRKTIKNLLIIWPKALCLEDMTSLKDLVIYHTERNAWNTVIVTEPCGGASNTDYIPFMIQWAAEQPKTGRIRVIVTESAITDGTPISALERCHPWIKRDHWEYAVQAWVQGKPWDVSSAEKEMGEKGIEREKEVKTRERQGESDIPKLTKCTREEREKTWRRSDARNVMECATRRGNARTTRTRRCTDEDVLIERRGM